MLNETYGLVILTYNRSDYLKRTIDSFFESTSTDIINNMYVVIVDDGSTEEKVFQYIKDMVEKLPNHKIIYNPKNMGITHSIFAGFDELFSYGVDYMMNVDSDVIFGLNWVNTIHNVYRYLPIETIVSGWSDFHYKPIEVTDNYRKVNVMPGVNIFFDNIMYGSIKDIVQLDNDVYRLNEQYHDEHWDIALTKYCIENQINMVCTKPCCIEHVGEYGRNTRPWYDIIHTDFKNIKRLL